MEKHEDVCRRIEKNRLTSVVSWVYDGLKMERSKEFILRKMAEENRFWSNGLAWSGCPIDPVVDEAIEKLEVAVKKLVV